ncbi:MAG: ABC-2 family transporter protein [Candidatus Eisenbacteria bacterium]
MGADLRVWMRMYGSMVAASVREQMSYRGSFAFELLGRLTVTGLELVGLLFLFEHVDAIAGWTKWEVIYLYGMASICLGLGEALTTGFDAMPELIRSGSFDYVLVRPLPALLFVLGREVKLRILGRSLQGALAVGLCLSHLMLLWDVGSVLLLVSSVICGVAVYAGLFLASAAQCFWTVESTEMFNAFTYGGAQMTEYPVSLYPDWLRSIFLYVVPVGFVSYVPAVSLLGKSDPLGLTPWGVWVTPVVAGAFLAVCLFFWRLGVRRYEGAGG